MSEQLRESISVLMDGEADELELRRLLSELSDEHKQTVDKTWSRYHLARDVMQGNDQGLAYQHLDISKQVSAAINNEPLAVSDSPSVASKLFKPVAGFAVAASVAMAVVVGVQSVNSVGPDLNGPTAAQPALASRVYPVQGTSLQAAGGSASGGVNYHGTELPGGIALSRAAADLEAQKRLEKYILRHTERAALNNGQGMISFARVASYETE